MYFRADACGRGILLDLDKPDGKWPGSWTKVVYCLTAGYLIVSVMICDPETT
jgi:hypothetical protein